MLQNAFVFVVCGERHEARLRIALRYLRRFSRQKIVVVSRAHIDVDCDQMITADVPAHLDNHRASIFLKTSLHRILGQDERRFCYVDTDVIAVNRSADKIFERARGPISFAADHCLLSEFGRFAVNCRCVKQRCGHLQDAIHKKFGVSIADPAWRHWNGGVFVFDRQSAEFMELWHAQTLSIFDDPYWKARDQGTLAATAWKLGWQNHPTLPREFNFVVDPFKSILTARSNRKTVKATDIPTDESYSLYDGHDGKPRPAFLHFINDGMGRRGWKNWDDVEGLLEKRPKRIKSPAPKVSSPAGMPKAESALSADNRIVHGLWIGSALTKMELLTIHSFLRHGHEFHLWLYDDLDTPLPKEVVIEDANAIIPQDRIIRKAEIDPESGVGKGSVSSPFSDLFRYKLLYDRGGYWVDMDVTCLQPFNFQTPYVFRTHRVGVVGNIMKCPPRSRLMKDLYEKVAREISPDTPWMMPNQMLSELVEQLGLAQYVRRDVWNEESWWEVIRPLMQGSQPIPSEWFAIHWINEFLRTLKESGGIYRGRRLLDVVPDKENPSPASALARLYSQCLPAPSPAATPVKAPMAAPLDPPARRQPPALKFAASGHVNILIESLARGGAERIVLETIAGLEKSNVSVKLFVLYQTGVSYRLPPMANVEVFRLHQLEPSARVQKIAGEVLVSPQPVLYTHLIRLEQLKPLWERGIKTIPVIHNSHEGWKDPAPVYNVAHVPFVVAVADDVAKQLRENGCSRPVTVIRHELQRWFSAEEQQRNRVEIRDRYGIADGTLLIGMVGEFKSQKVYTRAVRVLAQIRQRVAAKLMILGGWDHDWGHGRQTFIATQRLALDLGVSTDLLTPGPMPDAEKYYPAFDVFLNTSAYEGLSVSVLEAIQAGCPIVAADAGGTREVLPARVVLVKDSSDIAAYVNGIAQVLQPKPRVMIQKPPDSGLVPRLWEWLARYGRPDEADAASRSGILFLTDNLNIGGTQRSLINLLGHFPRTIKTWLGILQTVSCQGHLDEVERSGTNVFSLHDADGYLERVERILSLVQMLKVRHVCFWNVNPRVKLLLAKILPAGTVTLTDVSPGPIMYMQMYDDTAFQHRIAFSAEDYWRRLDHLVAKYPGGIPKNLPNKDSKAVVIPNGVVPPRTSDTTLWTLPPGADPDLVIGAVCRIAPDNRIDFLIEMMAQLNQRLKGASLVIVGSVDRNHADDWPRLQKQLISRQLTNIYFVGAHSDVQPFLRRLKVLVMMSETPGCPSASLEAMALGVPVVANAGGGIGQQIIHGINGFLVGGHDPKEMTRYVRYLLVNQEARRRFGQAAKITATKDFSVELMAQRYVRLFESPAPPAPASTKSSRPAVTSQKGNRRNNPVSL